MSIFRVLNLVQLQLRSASESTVGLNNLGRLMKRSASEPGLSLWLEPREELRDLFFDV